MDGKMFSFSNRPCRGRRVSFKRPRSNGMVNSVKKLMRREISHKADRVFRCGDNRERFRNMRLVDEYDTFEPKALAVLEFPFLKLRSKVMAILALQDVIFTLSHPGICAAFSRETKQMICLMNVAADELVISIFYIKINYSLITVSIYGSDTFTTLRCRSINIDYVRRGQPDAGIPLFVTESLKNPGFVEFDDVNDKVLTYDAQDTVYKVFDLKNYTSLFSITDKNVHEVKISPGIMLLIFKRELSHVPLQIISMEDGTVLKKFNHLLHRNKKLDFIEQFNEKLLVKQENENLQIRDVTSSEQIEVTNNMFPTPLAFIFLYEIQMFLTFRDGTVSVWNFLGELVTSFEDHLLWHVNCNSNTIYITRRQDLIVSYCKSDPDDICNEKKVGSVNISSIKTGKCLGKITPESGCPEDDDDTESSVKQKPSINSKRTRTSALEEVTALFYDEETNEIFTGNSFGMVHVWSN